MLQPGLSSSTDGGEFVEFFEAGTSTKGQFHCAECGYGVTVHTRLPVCPMCAGRAWEATPWSPFGRSAPTLL